MAIAFLCWMVLILSGCSAAREQTVSPRGAIEQLLLSHSVERSLAHLRIALLEDATVFLEIEGLPPDLGYVKTMVAEQLGLQQGQIREKKDEAQYLVQVIVHSMGTEQAQTMVGMPEIQAGFFPIATPELALYKVERQRGYVRLSLAVYETATGKLRVSTPWRAGSAFYHFFTVLFFITFPSTDLVLPPTPDSELSHALERTRMGVFGHDRNGEF